MALRITNDCICCGSCADACPLGIITMGDEHYEIDCDSCIECESCVQACADVNGESKIVAE